MNEFNSKNMAAITGAARGNGRATAFELGHNGFSLYLSDVQSNLLEDTISDLKDDGIEVYGGIFDASKLSDVDNLFEQLIMRYNKLDVFVNNAGSSKPQNFLEVTEENWDWTMDLNLKGPYFLMQKASKIMINQRSGSIVNIASISSSGGNTSSPPYAIAKSGIVNMTVTAAANLGKYGIRVNAVSPGVVNTNFHDEVDLIVGKEKYGIDQSKQLSDSEEKNIISKINIEKINNAKNTIPLGRLAESEDIAKTVAFLASDASKYITGETIVVGGGKSSL